MFEEINPILFIYIYLCYKANYLINCMCLCALRNVSHHSICRSVDDLIHVYVHHINIVCAWGMVI